MSRGVPLTVSTPTARDRDLQFEPVTVGVPLPRGWICDPSQLALADESGRDVPLQAIATERWRDGTLRWVLLDFQVRGRPAATRRYVLTAVSEPATARSGDGLTVHTAAGADLIVDTGVATFHVQPGWTLPVPGTSEGTSAVRATLVVTDARAVQHLVTFTRAALEQAGWLRATVRLDGAAGCADDPLLRVVARVQFFAGSSAVRAAVTVWNPRPARHPGGIWELGDRGSVFVRDVSLRVEVPGGPTMVRCSAAMDLPFERDDVPFEVYQDSSGGENWRSAVHLNRDNQIPCTFRGYRISSPGGERRGLRATPAVVVEYPAAALEPPRRHEDPNQEETKRQNTNSEHTNGRLTVAVEAFWQNFPKAIEVDSQGLTLRLFPRQFGDIHELQGGEQKTHRFAVAIGVDPIAADAVHWGRDPALAAADPEWYCRSDVVPHLRPASADRDRRYQELLCGALEGTDSFERKREAIDEYGWRHFGDLYADHENAFSGRSAPIVSHYNNQYDAIAGFACQFMRTGDARWWRLMRDLATHVADIDIYHTNGDKAAYNHGLFWHTAHYVDAGRSTHRTYPADPKVTGGGPCNEHNYASGLRLHWLLTGDPRSREAAIELADWVMAMDDGRKTKLRWLSAADTGLASATRSPHFHGPGRGPAHSILALVDGHRLTGAAPYLAKAEELIRRCIHPRDDIASLDLLDAERRWSYTVFLQALGKYLYYKEDLGEVDGAYAYARAALLHYARWMAEHEYPYLEKPEILEYPTETWAAQDLRKCDVFLFAAKYADGAERQRFLSRADFFYDVSVSMLLRSETRTRTRPLVLLLSNGFMYVGQESSSERTEAEEGFSESSYDRVPFVPQRTVVKKRLVAAVAAAGAVLAAALKVLSS